MYLDMSIAFPNLGITLNDLPMSISIFGFEIAFYGIIIGLGILAGMMISFREAKITGQNVDHYMDLAIYGVLFAIIGARLYYVIFEWDYFSKDLTQIFNIREGGLAIYGGVIAAILTAIVLSRIYKLSFFKMADTGCLGLLLGQAIGRWGNFFNREAFGGNSDGLFAMQINTNDGIANVYVPDAVDYLPGTRIIQVQPTFLYESVWNLSLLVLIMIFRKKKKFEGEVFAWYIGGYGVGRFIIEGFRTDQLQIGNTGIPISQVVAVCMFVAAVAICTIMRVRISKGLMKPYESTYVSKKDKILAGIDNEEVEDERDEVEAPEQLEE